MIYKVRKLEWDVPTPKPCGALCCDDEARYCITLQYTAAAPKRWWYRCVTHTEQFVERHPQTASGEAT